ncbi:hypothetical protein [Campylobacter sp. RM16192]|uniref:hypothetical protein n=1 Tax=Campylobacter sp. RM16192 TaxID=1660080 RepID=UPI00145158AC|nr:hypothetical protein [Campylobacter sp. RM16192]QCD52135.1 putative membrane protein [Campylobacter sp. RM16192]
MLSRTKEFIIRTVACCVFGFIISYYLSVKIPNFLDIVQNEKLVIANFLFMSIFTVWFLLCYIVSLRLVFVFMALFTTLAVAI